jgi:hypothetical protein
MSKAALKSTNAFADKILAYKKKLGKNGEFYMIVPDAKLLPEARKFLGDKINALKALRDSLPPGKARANAQAQINKLQNAKSYLDKAKEIIVDTLD